MSAELNIFRSNVKSLSLQRAAQENVKLKLLDLNLSKAIQSLLVVSANI